MYGGSASRSSCPPLLPDLRGATARLDTLPLVQTHANSATSNACRILLEAGERPTPVRVAVLDILLGSPTALAHQEITSSAHLLGVELDRVTLYRVLDWLVAKGLAHKITGDERAWRYSAMANGVTSSTMHKHAHFHCNQCGRLYCLDDIHPLPSLSLPQGFRCEQVELNLRGLCPDCTTV